MRHFGLIGQSLAHSFSQKYFNEKFDQLGITDATYINYSLEKINDYNKLIKQHRIAGLNVTIPFKEKIIPFLDNIDNTAKEIGAVNTIKFKEAQTIGYNTDVIGFRDSLLPLLKPHYKNALVLGTGGASKAVVFALNELNIHANLVSRNSNLTDSLIYQDINEAIIKENHIIINTTPVGTYNYPDQGELFDYSLITPTHLIYDLIYNPPITNFLHKAKGKGAVIKNGYEMLKLQAEASWKIWNDQIVFE